MTKSVYIIGGAGSGKSTFTAKLIASMGLVYCELEDLHSLRNAKALVTLRGHCLDWNGFPLGMYLGVNREQFPGSDGLDRASSPVGEAWLQAGDLPDFIVSEGATLATRRFLAALQDHTELLLVHLRADSEETQRRFDERGSNQDPKFVLNTVTRSTNLGAFMIQRGARLLSVDTTDEASYELALDLCAAHLQN